MTNLTTNDNAYLAIDRTVPDVSREFTITLTDAAVNSVQLPEDVKSAVIVASGAAIKFWPSYNDGVTDVLAGLKPAVTNSAANAATNNTLKNVGSGASFQEVQEKEFNKINAVITAGTGSATVYVYPGGGKPNDL